MGSGLTKEGEAQEHEAQGLDGQQGAHELMRSSTATAARDGQGEHEGNGGDMRGAATARSEPGTPAARAQSPNSANLQVQFGECLEVLQNCDQWSEEERAAFVKRIKDEKLDFLVDAQDNFGNTLLILAAMGPQDDVVELLLQNGSDPNHQNNAGFYSLHYCSAKYEDDAKRGKTKRIVELLLKHGAKTDLIEATAGCSPLHYAASENNSEVCNLLLDAGADVSLRCKNGFLPEAYARASGHNKLADHLHAKMKETVSQEVKAKIVRQGGNGGHGWKEHYDPNTGRSFYYNHHTLKSTWDRPVEMDLMDEAAQEKAEDAEEKGRDANKGEEKEDPGVQSAQAAAGAIEAGSDDEIPVIEMGNVSPGGGEEKRGKDSPPVHREPHTPCESPTASPSAPANAEPDLEKIQLRKQLEEMQQRLEEAQNRARMEAAQVQQLRDVAREADQKFEEQLAVLKTNLRDKAANEEESRKRVQALQQEFAENKKAEIERLKMQFEKERLAEIARLQQEADAERARHAEELGERMEQLEKMQLQLQKELKEKKQYYNEIEELKGSIRVCARVRPLSSKEQERGCHNVLEVFGDNIKLTWTKKDKRGEKQETKQWAFDKCLGPARGQEDVFEDTERLVQSAIDGYNVCIFAYGQTGAGKTYTMSGPAENPGILPRAVKTLCDSMRKQADVFNFSTELYMCELHLDTLVDLLSKKPGASSKSGFQIKKDQFGVVFVENITVLPVDTEEELMSRIREGEARRTVDSTAMNDTSSRSHLVISIVVRSENKVSGEITSGKLTLVDLAGSERVSKSGAEGQTFQEATSINKALSALGEVINALTNGTKHVPYRNNPLTQLMSDSIGGNAKTLMIVNVSPADYNAAETIASLNFASRCKSVRNAASKGFETKEIAMLRKEIAKLRRQKA